jgi:4-diphosphocytidyl-2-C-methyl-D-erythritol kinase
MISFPPCKINLGLHILRKRADGYHDLETAFYPVPWTDVLEIIPSEIFQFRSSGQMIPGETSDNLCVRAYHLLKKDFNIPPVHIYLHKVIPTGAGLGGGSADAAHTLRLLNNLFELNLSTARLQHYAARLGSDCAFFITDEPMLGQGRGEIISPIPPVLKGKYFSVIKPSIHVSTADAYAQVEPKEGRQSIPEILKQPIGRWKETLVNDFEASVFEKHPSLRQLKNDLYAAGAMYASMSGSGSSVFGIFETKTDVTSLLQTHSSWSGEL